MQILEALFFGYPYVERFIFARAIIRQLLACGFMILLSFQPADHCWRRSFVPPPNVVFVFSCSPHKSVGQQSTISAPSVPLSVSVNISSCGQQPSDLLEVGLSFHEKVLFAHKGLVEHNTMEYRADFALSVTPFVRTTKIRDYFVRRCSTTEAFLLAKLFYWRIVDHNVETQ